MAGTGTPATLTRLEITVVAVCGVVLFGDGFDSISMSFAAPVIAHLLSLTPQWQTLLIAAAPVGAVLGAVGLAPLGDRFGRKRLLIAAIVVSTAATLLNATAATLGPLLLWRLLTGVGIGMATPAAAALAGDIAPPHLRGRLVTSMFCGLSLGSIFAGLIAAPLVQRFGWPAVFVVGGILSVAVLPLVVVLLPRSPARSLEAPAGSAGSRPGVALLLAGGMLPVTLLVWLLVGMTGIAYTLISYWLPTLVTSEGFPFRTAALAGALMHLGGLIGCFVFGRLMDRIGPYRTMAGMYLVGTLAVLALGTARGAGPLLGASLLTGICIEGSIIGITAFCAGVYPTAIRATGMGWVTGVARLGGVLGPLLAGVLLSLHWRPTEIFYAVAVPTLAATAVVTQLHRFRGRGVVTP